MCSPTSPRPTNPTLAAALLGLKPGASLLPSPQPYGVRSLLPAPAPPMRNALAGLMHPFPPQNAPALSAIASALGSKPTPQLSAGASQFGLFASARPRASTILSDAMEMAAARKRRVFFSFHYQRDINRVNIVRNSWRFRPGDGTQPADWFDHSIWEEAKRTGTLALKRLIHGGMARSSVTCVLAGAETWGRPWVRYEIAYGLARGNGLLTVFIDGVKCMKTGHCARGPNPLDYMGLSLDAQGGARIWENFGGQWRLYPLYTDTVAWPSWLPKTQRGYISVLGRAAASYDYALQDGYSHLASWADRAAQQAGR